MKLKQFKTVLSYEYTRYLRNKVFIALTVVIVAAIFIGLSFPRITGLFKGDETAPAPGGEKPKIIVCDPGEVYENVDFLNAGMKQYEFTLTRDPIDAAYTETLKTRVDSGELTAALVVKDPLTLTLFQKENSVTSGFLKDQLQEVCKGYFQYSELVKDGAFSGEEAAQFVAGPVITPERVGKDFTSTYIYTYALLMLLYMTIMLYGQFVAVSVATEKSSRAMELLITSAKTNNLMFGKILGNGLAGLTQLLIWILSALAAYGLNLSYWKDNELINAVFKMPADIFVLMFVFYVLGFFTFAAIYGAIGSLVSRVEDINTVSMPVILLFLAGFMMSIFGMMTPDAGWFKAVSFIPVFTPMVMFVRACMSAVPIYELAIAIALTAVFAWLIGILASKVYRIGVLMYGKPPSVRELATALRNEKKY